MAKVSFFPFSMCLHFSSCHACSCSLPFHTLSTLRPLSATTSVRGSLRRTLILIFSPSLSLSLACFRSSLLPFSTFSFSFLPSLPLSLACFRSFLLPLIPYISSLPPSSLVQQIMQESSSHTGSSKTHIAKRLYKEMR